MKNTAAVVRMMMVTARAARIIPRMFTRLALVVDEGEADGIKSRGDAPLKSPLKRVECAER